MPTTLTYITSALSSGPKTRTARVRWRQPITRNSWKRAAQNSRGKFRTIRGRLTIQPSTRVA